MDEDKTVYDNVSHKMLSVAVSNDNFSVVLDLATKENISLSDAFNRIMDDWRCPPKHKVGCDLQLQSERGKLLESSDTLSHMTYDLLIETRKLSETIERYNK